MEPPQEQPKVPDWPLQDEDGVRHCDRCGQKGPGKPRWMFMDLVMTTTLEREFHCFKCIKRMRLYGMIALILLLIVLGGVYWFANAGNFL